VKTQLKVFWLGLAIYAVSFFLLATGGSSVGDGRMPGFLCAWFALAVPVSEALRGFRCGPFENNIFAYFALLISGWINPVFLLTAFLDLSDSYRRAVSVLRIIVTLMLPFCWIFFYYFRNMYYPREGHFVWIIGMLLTLFSHEIAER
jgi:hypothetical protein